MIELIDKTGDTIGKIIEVVGKDGGAAISAGLGPIFQLIGITVNIRDGYIQRDKLNDMRRRGGITWIGGRPDEGRSRVGWTPSPNTGWNPCDTDDQRGPGGVRR